MRIRCESGLPWQGEGEERYGGATDVTLQRLRYLREAVFLKRLSPEQAAIEAGRQSKAVAVTRGTG